MSEAVAKSGPWTAAEDAYLLQAMENASTRDIARHLGRRTLSVSSRMHKLCLRRSWFNRQRPWTKFSDDEIAVVRRMEGSTGAEIAAALGPSRDEKSVHYIVRRIGVKLKFSDRYGHQHGESVRDDIRRLNSDGMNDHEIALKLGIRVRQASGLRMRMGLPVAPAGVARGRAHAAKTLSERLKGKPLPAACRANLYRTHREYAIESGWPSDLPIRCVQILNVLAEHGPQNIAQLAERIGAKLDYRKRLTATGLSATGHLARRDLIFCIQPKKGRRDALTVLYVLSPAAIIQRAAALQRTAVG